MKKRGTHHSRLAGIIAGLLLGYIGRMSAHGRSSNADAAPLLAEHEPRGAEAVVGAVEVDGPDVVPVLDAVVEAARLGGDAGVGDHHVEAAEVRDDLGHRRLDRAVVPDVHLVREHLSPEVLADGLGQGRGLLRCVVPER